MNLNWRGLFVISERYAVGDIVYNPYDGFTYICVRDTTRRPPNFLNSGFELLAGFNITRIDGGYF
jgi:hypothetical protein